MDILANSNNFSILIVLIVGIVVIACAMKRTFCPAKICEWCGKKMIWDSEVKHEKDGIYFCSLKCKMKYLNEQADMQDRQATVGKSKNININDRNKYL